MGFDRQVNMCAAHDWVDLSLRVCVCCLQVFLFFIKLTGFRHWQFVFDCATQKASTLRTKAYEMLL